MLLKDIKSNFEDIIKNGGKKFRKYIPSVKSQILKINCE